MELSVMVWPLLVALPGADLLIGAGGYNTVYESRAIGVPLLAKGQSRLYDRQKRRLFYNEFCDGDDAILKSVRLWIEKQPQPKSSANPVYANGAKAAFDEIASRWMAREPQSRI